jgi:predicted transcriptional regulator
MLVVEEAVEIRVLSRQGKSVRAIARTLGVSRNTVRRYLRSDGLPHYERGARPGKLDQFKHYIAERVTAAAPEWIPATVEMDTVVEGYAVTPQGWRKLSSGTLSSSGNKTPGMIMPAAVAIATGNPLGLIVVGGMKVYGEASGRNTLEGEPNRLPTRSQRNSK